MALRVGSVVAGYTIEGILGSGGMGTVYRAKHPALPRSDALKVLSAELSRDPQFRARFEREAELAASLDHPNIVTVYNRGETEDGQLWIAMQLVRGSDAEKELREGHMTPRRALHIVTEVAKALDYAHRRKLLHRDVKPANFLLAPDDERIFLADFGIARALDEAVGLTQTGMVLASVAYASPESLSAEGVDARADIYSLGCSLFALLTRHTPFARSGGMAAMAAGHLSQPPPRVTDLVPALPPAIDAVIAKAMAKDPAARYQTARAFAAAAAEALDDTGEIRTSPTSPGAQGAWPTTPPASHQRPAPPPPPGYLSGPPRSPAPTGPEALSYPSGQFSGPASPPFTAPPSAAQPVIPPSAAPPKRRRRAWIAAGAVAAIVITAAVVGGMLLTRGSDEPRYQPQSVSHVHGSTQIDSQPHAVAAIGPGDGEAVLSLGMQPVAIVAPGAGLPSWEQQLVTTNVKVLSNLDTTAITAAKPDLIIATGDIDDATYNTLAAIAPTVTRPPNVTGTQWTWQDQLSWIGRIVGREDKAGQLIDTTRSQQADLRAQHPAFDSKTVEVINVSDNGITETLLGTNAANYLEGLGFRYSQDLKRAPTDTGDVRPIANPDDLNLAPTAVRVVVRTDKAAGGGSYNGLPKPFTQYPGATVIVDDPNVIAALNTGGFAATEFLNSTFVDALAQQVH